MKKQIFDELNLLCVPTSIVGRDYLETAIELMIIDPDIKKSITKRLYPTIALKHNSTSIRVERSIRHAISKSINNLDSDFIISYFGYHKELKITNSEYISMIARRLQFKEAL